MKILELPSAKILTPINREAIYTQIERIARTCYKSEDKITEDSAAGMVRGLVAREHYAMIEHAHITVKFIVDRGISHEIVRHRIASFAQESTRYCNYSSDGFGNEITVIKPPFWEEGTKEYQAWYESCALAEIAYMDLLKYGAKPEEARTVLPTSLKTELVVTFNLREWMHFFNLRAIGTTGNPHPQMRQIAIPLLEAFAKALPEVFGKQWEQMEELIKGAEE